MQSKSALIIALTSLAACGGRPPQNAFQFVDRPSLPGCTDLDATREQTLRDRAARFFEAEVQADTRNLRIARGVVCNGEILFAVSVDDADFRQPFFVRMEASSGTMELMRPQ